MRPNDSLLTLAVDKRVSHLYWHGPQVRTEEEEPHELVGIYGNQIADLTNS